MSDWYTIRNQSPGIADVAITGVIEAGGAQRFLSALPRAARTIRLSISSLGGDPTAAMAIAQALRAHSARVEVTIQGIAASAATLPVMAGHHVTMSADGVGMIHNPGLVPNPDDTTPRDARTLRAAAVELDRIKDRMLDTYAWRLKGGREAIARLMDNTTWLDPAEAVRLGLADEVGAVPPSAVAAHVDALALAHLGPIPPRFRALIARLRDPRGTLAPLFPAESITGLYARREAERRAPLLNVAEIYRRLNTPTQGGRL